MNTHLKSRCLFTVEAENDPQVPCRILGLFTQRGRLPEWFSVRKFRENSLRIVVEIGEPDEHLCKLLSMKMLNIPTVVDVSRARLAMREDLVP